MPREDEGSWAEDEDVDAAAEEAPADDGGPSDDATVVEDADDADAGDDAPKLVVVVVLLGVALDAGTPDELLAVDVALPATEPGPLCTDEDRAREDAPVEESREEVDPALELPGGAPPDDVELVPTAPELPPPGSAGVPQPPSSTSIRPTHARGFTLRPNSMMPPQAGAMPGHPARWNAALQTRVTPGVTFWVTDLVTAAVQQVGATRTATPRHDCTRAAVAQAPPMKRTLWAVLVLAPTWWSCAGSPDPVVLESCGNARPAALAGCIEQRLYVEDLSFVAQERLPGTNAWQLVQTYVKNRLEALGYTVELHQDDGAVNVIGKRTGALRPKEEVMVSAHYDHIQGCAGADDNGSGVAAALEIARVLATADFDRTTTVAFWDLEEVGLVGSAAYARRARWRGEKITMNYVLETMGFASDEPGSQKIPTGFDVVYPRQVAQVEANENRGDFLTMVADPSANPAVALLEAFAQAVDLPAITLRTAQVSLPFTKDLRRSDHQSFWNMGYPAMMLTDGANFRNPGYHCLERPDTLDTLNHPFAVKIARAVAYAAATQAGMPGLPP